MFETIHYDPQLSQKAREYLRQLEEMFLAEQRENRQEMCEVLLYLNNLITTHYCRYHEDGDENIA
ncbi:hypothetical protein [Vibrio gazogenes]|uniref:Uncharacterized protein n=1 Tax=Vibrio gazogenes DSM 21264 = NBRC 103151 TaxID=1123492 RepID=A0A1M4YGC4_VIBGA|nr:hypothetical protein [Vibrio gazogenes]USP14974.1 hypothetical protein MKS89_06645 [Vibrio gazogenes]SHF04825.1 hypothetical protein SAMN02745781_01309 [Vibrio gazogenes DSM 21264] [Vibrio gazogenes DSM 21264 = NBRC 103151]SJN55838.1 hypothetical protein BQ6471_01744 [Vibrio gazogenes]